jgi:hypothetical protein
VWSFLKDIDSPRANEFRIACDENFDMSTVFKTPDQLAVIEQGTMLKAQDVDD